MSEEVAVSLRLKVWSQNYFSEHLQTVRKKDLNKCIMVKISTIFIYISQFFLNKEQSWKDRKATKINKVSFNC